MKLSTTGDPVFVQGDGLLFYGCAGPGVGSFSKSIHAITCVAQGGKISGDTYSTDGSCAGGATVRTNGDSFFPCAINGDTTRTTYACHVDLPSGILIDQVTAYGMDVVDDGYFEAAIWRTGNTTIVANYISPTFAGTWQNSGVAASPGITSFPIYLDSDPPHTVAAGYRYTIGFAAEAPTGGNLQVYGFEINYTILPE